MHVPFLDIAIVNLETFLIGFLSYHLFIYLDNVTDENTSTHGKLRADTLPLLISILMFPLEALIVVI